MGDLIAAAEAWGVALGVLALVGVGMVALGMGVAWVIRRAG